VTECVSVSHRQTVEVVDNGHCPCIHGDYMCHSNCPYFTRCYLADDEELDVDSKPESQKPKS